MIGNILIVDDEASLLKLLKDILSAEGHQLRLFNSGELALRSIMAEAPELILLDVRMPGLNGFEVCKRIKQDPRLKDIPVIFISAATDMEDKVRAFEQGGVDYITKPFQKEEVVARVKTHIALSHTIQRMKKIADDLQKSEASLNLAQSLAHLGHWELDINSGRFVCSDEMCRILGLKPHVAIPDHQAFLQAVHADDRARVAAHLDEIQGGSGADIEYRIVLPDGTVRVVHGKGALFCSAGRDQDKIVGTIQHVHEHSLTKMIGVIQDITENKELRDKLLELANKDALTGCNSRRYFLEHAELEFNRLGRYGGAMSVLMLDLDRFKTINDQYGHQIGDITLKKFVSVCQALMREVDIMGRLGGEEFAIMLPETGSKQALDVAKRLCQAVAAAEIPLKNNLILHFTTSIGVGSLTKDDSSIDLLINRADKALYKAKNLGRNMACA
jgi:two-component system cell cycle response regulator